MEERECPSGAASEVRVSVAAIRAAAMLADGAPGMLYRAIRLP